MKQVLGLNDPWIALAYLLCFGSTALVVCKP
ncbi:symporter small accessory protein [Methylomusa anaerophila]